MVKEVRATRSVLEQFAGGYGKIQKIFSRADSIIKKKEKIEREQGLAKLKTKINDEYRTVPKLEELRDFDLGQKSKEGGEKSREGIPLTFWKELESIQNLVVDLHSLKKKHEQDLSRVQN